MSTTHVSLLSETVGLGNEMAFNTTNLELGIFGLFLFKQHFNNFDFS